MFFPLRYGDLDRNSQLVSNARLPRGCVRVKEGKRHRERERVSESDVRCMSMASSAVELKMD